MGKKRLTIEYIKRQFEKEGYELLSEEYVTTQTKLKYRCPKGHVHSISWNHFQAGDRCPHCSGKAKKTIEFIRSEFEKNSYILLTEEYINNKQKLEYICPNGHKHCICWANWISGCRCSYCSGNVNFTIEFIKAEFVNEGYTLLTTEYVNAHQALKYICPVGHEHSISWANWYSGKRCPYCAGLAKLEIGFIRSEFAEEGCELLTTEYINCKQKLEYICPEGHRHSITWSNWKAGHRCPTCFYINNSGSGNYNWKNYSKEDLQKLSIYRDSVWQLTNHNYRKCKNIINPLDLPRRRKKYSLDHIYSISDGFRDGVPAEILASPINLQVLPYYENIVKRTRSDISLNELCNRHNNWEKENAI